MNHRPFVFSGLRIEVGRRGIKRCHPEGRESGLKDSTDGIGKISLQSGQVRVCTGRDLDSSQRFSNGGNLNEKDGPLLVLRHQENRHPYHRSHNLSNSFLISSRPNHIFPEASMNWPLSAKKSASSGDVLFFSPERKLLTASIAPRAGCGATQ